MRHKKSATESEYLMAKDTFFLPYTREDREKKLKVTEDIKKAMLTFKGVINVSNPMVGLNPQKIAVHGNGQSFYPTD